MSTEKSLVYKEYTITAMPAAVTQSNRFLCRVSISKLENGVPDERMYTLESDVTNLDDAIAFCFQKGKEIIDGDPHSE